MKYVELKDLGKDERNICDWIRNQQNDVYIGTIFKAIASSSAGEAIKKYKLKDAFDKLALKLNNFVHSNGQLYYNFSYQRMDTHSNISKILQRIWRDNYIYNDVIFDGISFDKTGINYVRRLH